MEIYRKNRFIETKEQAESLLAEMDIFVKEPVIGKAQPMLDAHLLKIWNNGEHLGWEWSDESQQEYDRRITKEQREAEQLAFWQDHANIEAWKNAKVRPWRNSKLYQWIDETFMKPLLYVLSSGQEAERIAKRQELLDWPGTIGEYKTDAELEALRPSAPSWISE